jgi:hypothetical protein
MAPPAMNPLILGTELTFTVITVVFCFLIYFKTKEIYDLSKYEGIRHFRMAFLFLGLSYLVRFFSSLLMLSRAEFHFILPRELFAALFILPMGYFSTIGIFYLIFNFMRKKFKHLVLMGHIIAAILSLTSFVTRSSFVLFWLQLLLLILAVILISLRRNSEKKFSKIRVLYLLVALLWLINLLVAERRHLFPLPIEIILHTVSLVLFAVVYYKISKQVR